MSGDGASIRAYRPGDLHALHEIRRAAFAPVFKSFREILGDGIGNVVLAGAEAEQARLLDVVCADGSAHRVLVAEDGGAIVGFAAFTADADARLGEIGLNAVHPDHAGRGVGTQLYGEALVRMRALGVEVAMVSTGGDPSHAPARRAYEKAGFGPAIPSLTLHRRL